MYRALQGTLIITLVLNHMLSETGSIHPCVMVKCVWESRLENKRLKQSQNTCADQEKEECSINNTSKDLEDQDHLLCIEALCCEHGQFGIG